MSEIIQAPGGTWDAVLETLTAFDFAPQPLELPFANFTDLQRDWIKGHVSFQDISPFYPVPPGGGVRLTAPPDLHTLRFRLTLNGGWLEFLELATGTWEETAKATLVQLSSGAPAGWPPANDVIPYFAWRPVGSSYYTWNEFDAPFSFGNDYWFDGELAWPGAGALVDYQEQGHEFYPQYLYRSSAAEPDFEAEVIFPNGAKLHWPEGAFRADIYTDPEGMPHAIPVL